MMYGLYVAFLAVCLPITPIFYAAMILNELALPGAWFLGGYIHTESDYPDLTLFKWLPEIPYADLALM